MTALCYTCRRPRKILRELIPTGSHLFEYAAHTIQIENNLNKKITEKTVIEHETNWKADEETSDEVHH